MVRRPTRTAGMFFLALYFYLASAPMVLGQTLVDYALARDPISSIGNIDVVNVVHLPPGHPNGRTAVLSRRVVSHMQAGEQLVTNIKHLATQGIFVPIIDTKIQKPNSKNGNSLPVVYVLMQDMRKSRSGKAVIASGSLKDLGELRELPREQRKRIRNRFLMLVLRHPDFHGENVMFRAVSTLNGVRVDIHQVDPYQRTKLAWEITRDVQQVPPRGLVNYDVNLQASETDRLLGLTPSPHPAAALRGMPINALKEDRSPIATHCVNLLLRNY